MGSQVILHLEVKHNIGERLKIWKRDWKNEERCFAFAAQRTEFPDDPILKFENIQKQVEAQFTVYADFESILKQLSAKCQEHIAFSYAYQIVSSIPGIEFGQRLYVGVDATGHFLDALQDISIDTLYHSLKKMLT